MNIIAWSDNDDLCQEVRKKASTLGTLKQINRQQLPDQDPSTIAAGIAKAAKENDVDMILIGATKLGKAVAPMLAGNLDWPYAAEVHSIESGDKITVKRMVLSGNSLATYTMGKNAVCTATIGTFETTENVEADKIALSAPASTVVVTGKRGAAHSDFDLTSAAVVVGVGRGFKAQADLAIAENLAKKFPGGAVGCSRPIAADLKWLGEEHWIGLSGNQIRPKAYIAVGVSGQIQHIAGIRKSKLIIAINTNKDAPIFSICDYGIVGDLYKVLPKLAELL